MTKEGDNMDKRYQVFISSTYTDLKEERNAIIEGLLNAKYIPAGMEMFAASNEEQFQYIKKIIDTCDYYVLIVGARYGTINASTGKSFTEQEYDYAIEKGIPVLAFLHNDPYNLPADKREDDKKELLESFRAKASAGRMCKMWSSSSELISSVIISLGQEAAENPQKGWTRGSIEDNAELLSQLNTLRINKENIEKDYKALKVKYSELTKQREDLACGSDTYRINGILNNYNNDIYERNIYETKDTYIVLTWDDIFSAIGPYLTAPKSVDGFKEDLKESINAIYGSTFSYINSDCIQTIKIQLNALNLVKTYQAKNTAGGLTEGIVISDKGIKYLTELRAIKK